MFGSMLVILTILVTILILYSFLVLRKEDLEFILKEEQYLRKYPDLSNIFRIIRQKVEKIENQTNLKMQLLTIRKLIAKHEEILKNKVIKKKYKKQIKKYILEYTELKNSLIHELKYIGIPTIKTLKNLEKLENKLKDF